MSDETLDSTTTQPTGDTVDATETEATETTPAAETHGLPGAEETQETGDTDPDEEEATEEEKPAGAPEKYEAFDVSEGKDIEYAMTEEQHEVFSKISKDLGLNQDQAQSLVKFDIERNKAMAEQNKQFVKDYTDDGVKAARKEHGEKYSERVAKNNAVFQKFFPEDTRKFLNDSGISAQAGFFNALNAISSAMSEDVTVQGDGGSDKRSNTLKGKFIDLNKT